MQENPLTKSTIKGIVNLLKAGRTIRMSLPGSGKLVIEKPLPFLLIYRRKPDETSISTLRLIASEVSYLVIGTEEFKAYQELLVAIAGYMSVKHQSYLIIEIWISDHNDKDFHIKAPVSMLPTTVDALAEGLTKLDEFFQQIKIGCKKTDTLERHPDNSKTLLDEDDLKNSGCLLIGLEIPQIFIAEQHTYNYFFRHFHNQFSKALHNAIFDFIRVQTENVNADFGYIGKASIDRLTREIDAQLCEIEQSYQFLWLISPSNIADIKEAFLASKGQKVLDYHYRLLPIDPDMVKRKLYNLQIDQIEDPSIAHLFLEKREEIDLQITMLRERGTGDFFYNSLRLYDRVSDDLLNEAITILKTLPEQDESPENEIMIDAKTFSRLATEECDLLRKQSSNFVCKVHVRPDVNIMMVSKGELYIPADYKMSSRGARALLQHEVGTHSLTYFNGTKQPLKQFAYGLADYDGLQEGMAVLSEYLVKGLTANRLRILAGRVVAGASLQDGADFNEVYSTLLKYDLSKERAFNITSRFFQGSGFMKDIIYLRGLMEIIHFLKEGGELEPLYLGKIASKHIDLIKSLLERKMINPPEILPSFFSNPEARERLNKVRNGLALAEMADI